MNSVWKQRSNVLGAVAITEVVSKLYARQFNKYHVFYIEFYAFFICPTEDDASRH